MPADLLPALFDRPAEAAAQGDIAGTRPERLEGFRPAVLELYLRRVNPDQQRLKLVASVHVRPFPLSGKPRQRALPIVYDTLRLPNAALPYNRNSGEWAKVALPR